MDPGRLDMRAIVATAEQLSLRIDDRFADRGLGEIGRHVVETARATHARLEALNRPRWVLRLTLAGIICGAVIVTLLAVAPLDLGDTEVRSFADWVALSEAAIQDLVFIGLAGVFLRSLEGRARRREALSALHELRSLAHVVDMHQLTKDPEALLSPENRTEHSPPRTMSRFELTRYLDYCSEMLSLIAKLAAMYAQETQDAVVLAAVREIQDLGSGLSGEVWQKIILLSRRESL